MASWVLMFITIIIDMWKCESQKHESDKEDQCFLAKFVM